MAEKKRKKKSCVRRRRRVGGVGVAIASFNFKFKNNQENFKRTKYSYREKRRRNKLICLSRSNSLRVHRVSLRVVSINIGSWRMVNERLWVDRSERHCQCVSFNVP